MCWQLLHAWAQIPNVCLTYTRLGSRDNTLLQKTLDWWEREKAHFLPASSPPKPCVLAYHPFHIKPWSRNTSFFFLIYMLLQSPVSNQIPTLLLIYKSLLGCVSTHVSARACMRTHNNGQSYFSRMTQTNVSLERLVPNQFVIPFKETNLDVYISKQCIGILCPIMHVQKITLLCPFVEC